MWGDDQRFIDSYLSAYPGCYLTGDGGHVDADGYLFVMGRTDDVINVAGHRLSTGSVVLGRPGQPLVGVVAGRRALPVVVAAVGRGVDERLDVAGFDHGHLLAAASTWVEV